MMIIRNDTNDGGDADDVAHAIAVTAPLPTGLVRPEVRRGPGGLPLPWVRSSLAFRAGPPRRARLVGEKHVNFSAQIFYDQ